MKIIDGIMGLCVADALGVPVEFTDREELVNNPVVTMRGYGTHNQPVGTWSDDTSMTLCLVDSLINGVDYDQIMSNFRNWFRFGAYTPYQETFDIGLATQKALIMYERGEQPLKCGGKNEMDNGNGSLMRILPIVYYLRTKYKSFHKNEEAMEIIHNVSSLTHAHKRSLIACGIYCMIASNLLDGMSIQKAVEQGVLTAFQYYQNEEYYKELMHYKRLLGEDFINISIDNIKSTGYVVDTIEASLWCLLNTESYKSCVLKSVNLGDDTDTVAAIAGGLAGIYYGYDKIPTEWLNVIAKRDYIEKLCMQFSQTLN